MARPGRKRKAVAREPNGRAVRSEDPTKAARDYRLARGATNDNWRAQEHATPLGHLFLSGMLDHPSNPDAAKRRYEAGVWYRGLWLAKNAALNLPSPFARPPGQPISQGSGMDPAECQRAIRRETAALNCVPRGTKAPVYSIICLEREVMFDGWLEGLIAALDALAIHREGC